ncbi:hypothetical protein PMZ80_006066 [Knufia obscura]|uniref:Uncharacterized protein n=2 Tax=Knufia TaxID=430999 RepID=A0AAN8EVL9_9EURO|nr:hypothetical protein PMZ80_006066 [Knufia obscura]KAK5954736.1 hypothetical protein OHC33_004460 [Knufia fluminis]
MASLASLTLLGLPAEVRLLVLKYALMNTTAEPEIDLYLSNDDSFDDAQDSEASIGDTIDDRGRSSSLKWKAFNWDVQRPLFCVCKQIRNEARDCFRIEVTISRTLRCHATKRDTGEVCVKRFLRADGREIEWDGSPTEPGVLNDDYRGLLNGFLRRSVVKLSLWNKFGVDGAHINREQFPNLEVLIVESLVRPEFVEEVTEGRIYEPELEAGPSYRLKKRETPFDVKAGKFDAMLVVQAKTIANEHTMTRMPSLKDRGFKILMEVRCHISGHPSHPGTQWTAAADLRLTFDYDTNEVVRRWNWWHNPAYGEEPVQQPHELTAEPRSPN